jgi:hypothetical protein
MEAISSSETSVDFQLTPRRYNISSDGARISAAAEPETGGRNCYLRLLEVLNCVLQDIHIGDTGFCVDMEAPPRVVFVLQYTNQVKISVLQAVEAPRFERG